MKAANPRGKQRDRDSIATNDPVPGWRYSRRRVALDRSSVTAAPTTRRATAAGIGPYPSTTAAVVSPPSSVASVITRLTATGSGVSAGRPVTRSTSVSAMT